MTTLKRSVYLLSEQQRNALLNYLQNRPYREVAAGIQLLMNAPTAQVDVEIPEGSEIGSSAETEEKVEANELESAAEPVLATV